MVDKEVRGAVNCGQDRRPARASRFHSVAELGRLEQRSARGSRDDALGERADASAGLLRGTRMATDADAAGLLLTRRRRAGMCAIWSLSGVKRT